MTQPYAPQPFSYAGPNIPVYHSSEGRGKVVRALLWATLVLSLASIGLTGYQLRLPPGAFESDDFEMPMPALIAIVVWGLLTVGVFIGTVVVFCMWMYRAHANLHALGIQGQDYTSGWAAGAWFVPFLNLVRPFRIMKEIWKGSDPATVGAADFAWKLAADPAIIGLWWAAWIFSNVASRVSSRMDRGDVDLQYAALYVDLANVPITVAAAWLAIRITRRIDDMQAERFNALSQYHFAAQPPSSIYAYQQ
jgi:hypothetical protein